MNFAGRAFSAIAKLLTGREIQEGGPYRTWLIPDNAPAIWQWVLMETLDASIDPAPYEHKRNVLCRELARIGYEVTPPEGSFYIFLKTPIADDIAFSAALAKEGVLTVPGTGFGRSGYLRLSLTLPLERVEKSVGGFERAFRATPPSDQSMVLTV